MLAEEETAQVREASHAVIANGSLNAYVATVSLPADGLWVVQDSDSENPIRELYLTPTDSIGLRQLGKRMYAALEEQQIERGRWSVQMGFEACRQYAQEHDATGPAKISDLAGDKRWEYVAKRWDSAHYRLREFQKMRSSAAVEGPFVFLVPNVPFRFTEPQPRPSTEVDASGDVPVRKTVVKANRAVLAFELRPFIDDGKHWVVFTDGQCERIEIDEHLSQKHNARIQPIMKREEITGEPSQPKMDYQLVMIADQSLSKEIEVKAFNQVLDRRLAINWDLKSIAESKYDELGEGIVRARKFAWHPYLSTSSAGVLKFWDSVTDFGESSPNRRRSLSMFSILGGRAAIEETLQLQDLAVTSSPQEATIEIDSLKGVEVKSHPFDDMLGGDPGGQLEMARLVPADRFFLYIGKPESVPAMLDRGAPFIATLGTSLTGNCLNYNLQSRYLAKLGMTRDWVDAVLASGMTSEMAIFAPDLFFIDGTDMTVVARLRQPQLLQQLLTLLGASDLSTKSILELPTGENSNAYLALRDDLLFASTNRSELDASLQLHQQQGDGSLGASSEFRYMLTKLGVNDQTRLYAYFSDPFVRRLVGPRVKIGQRRRVLAKAKMEALTARLMLARLDGLDVNESSLTDRFQAKYLPQHWQFENVSVNDSGLVRSEHYGTLPRMRTLPETPLDRITPEEAEAYERYQENYSRYWRRFFDPIAIRLDEVGGDQLELSTFILPLVDNSIYNGLRQFLAHQDDGVQLTVPIVEPTPVVQFSANLKEDAWRMLAGNFSDFFTRYSGASSAMLDDFGPAVHVAIFDADPIVAIGSGDVFGAFSGNVLRGNGSQMVIAPVALSMLTRPCSIMVETRSPERTAQYLRQAALAGIGRTQSSNGFQVSFYQVDDRDEWVWTVDIFGVVKLRYGIEVVGKYMVIRNIPWSSEDHVVSAMPAELNAAVLQANPAACRQQLPGLYAAAADSNRRAVMSGLARLYPFMLTGAKNVEQARKEHQRLFGFYPKELEGDRWYWKDYRMASQDYGEPLQQRQPAFDPSKPFGLMNQIESLRLNMQFEDDGLRSTIVWRLR